VSPAGRAVIALVSIVALGKASAALAQAGDCPQQRSTVKAPDDIYVLKNPQRSSPERIAVGRRLYEKGAIPACEMCHGPRGDGKGTLATQFQPRPRNFTCAEMLDEIPDGQLFWIIRNGSPDTAMPGYKKLSDRSIWRIILYLRTLSKPK
jgi:mono/diheme cytochrome c family protein